MCEVLPEPEPEFHTTTTEEPMESGPGMSFWYQLIFKLKFLQLNKKVVIWTVSITEKGHK